MRCSRTKRLISEYVDGNLNTKKKSNLERHLSACTDCKKLLEEFQQIVDKAKDLEERVPSVQPWLKIRARLETEKQEVLTFPKEQRRRLGLLFQPPRLKYVLSGALVAAFVVIVALFGVWYWSGKDILTGEALQKYTLAKLNEAEHHYQLAIKALWEAVSVQEEAVDPQVAEAFKKNLEIIDSSIVACRQLILEEPDNIEARNYLLAAYREKLDFLNKMMEAKKKSSSKRLGTTI